MPENMDDVEAFYLPAGERTYEPTFATMSPWDPAMQHGGPPAGLLTHEMSALVDPSLRMARLSVDFLGPMPRKTCHVEARVTKPGKRVCRTEATLSVDGRVVAAASAWHIATGPTPPALGVHDLRPPPIPDEQPQRYFAGKDRWGYGQSTEWRFTSGSYNEPGPVSVWTRLRVPLIAGRTTTGLEQAAVVGDSANGLSNELPIGQWLFIPPTLTITALREPVGEWVFLDTASTLSNDGLGLAQAKIADAEGLCAVVAQPLLIAAT